MALIDEQDLELLEAYLDYELTDEVRTSLARRLEREEALAGSLEALRAERFIRQQAFDSLAPDERSAHQFAWNVSSRLKVDEGLPSATPVGIAKRSKLQNILRIVSTAAASIIVGFLVGWATRGPWGTAAGDNNVFTASPTSLVRMPIMDDQGQMIALQDFENPQSVRDYSRRVKLGIVVRPGQLKIRNASNEVTGTRPAFLIAEVFPNSLADHAGLKMNDIIVSFAGKPVTDAQTFAAAVSKQSQATTMTVVRNGKMLDIPFDLREQ